MPHQCYDDQCEAGEKQNVIAEKTIEERFYKLFPISGDPVTDQIRNQKSAGVQQEKEADNGEPAFDHVPGRGMSCIQYADTHREHPHRSAEGPADDRVKQIRNSVSQTGIRCTFYKGMYKRKTQDRERLAQIQCILSAGVDRFICK